MRYLLSHDFNDAQRSHIRRKLAETGDFNLRLIVWLLFDNCVEFRSRFPHPANNRSRSEMDQERNGAARIGMEFEFCPFGPSHYDEVNDRHHGKLRYRRPIPLSINCGWRVSVSKSECVQRGIEAFQLNANIQFPHFNEVAVRDLIFNSRFHFLKVI